MIKTLIMLLMLFITTTDIVPQPTVETRLTRIEDSLGIQWGSVILPPDSSIVYPTSLGLITTSSISDFFIFNPALIYNGKYYTFAVKGAKTTVGISDNGLNNITWYPSNAPYGTVILGNNNTFLNSYHKWWNGKCDTYIAASSDGITFSDIYYERRWQSGEDRKLLTYLNASGVRVYEMFIRPNVPMGYKRTIGRTVTTDFRNWPQPVEVFKPDNAESVLHIEYYHGSVIKLASGYWMVYAKYQKGLYGEDVEGPPIVDVNSAAQTVTTGLAHSPDGNTWTPLLNKQPFIKTTPGTLQCYPTWGQLPNGIIRIYTIESQVRKNNTANGFYYSKAYEITEANLLKNKH